MFVGYLVLISFMILNVILLYISNVYSGVLSLEKLIKLGGREINEL